MTAISTVPSVNFTFLQQHDPSLLSLAALAERYVFDGPNTALIKIRQLAESFAKSVAAMIGLPCGPEETFLDVERRLRNRGVLDHSVRQIMRTVRLAGNDAVHNLIGGRREAFQQLKLVRQLAVWFHRTVTRNPIFHAGTFQPPPDPADADELLREELQFLRQEIARHQALHEGVQLEAEELQQRADEAGRKAAEAYANEQTALGLAEEFEAELRTLRAEYELLLQQRTDQVSSQPPGAQDELRTEVASAAHQASASLDLDEFDTRKLIDQQLRDVGWEAASELLARIRKSRECSNSTQIQ